MRFFDIALLWKKSIKTSSLYDFGRTAMVAASTSLFAKCIGFVKELVVAGTFGLSGELDVYLVAFVLIGMPMSVLLNAIQTSLITRLAGSNQREISGPSLFVGTVVATLVLLIISLILWFYILPNLLPLLARGFSKDKLNELHAALLWLTPYYFLNGLNLLGYGVLQSKNYHFYNGIIPTLTPLVIIILLNIGIDFQGWKLLAFAICAGTAFEFIALFTTLYKIKYLVIPSRLPLQIARDGAALLPGTLIQAFGPVFDQAMAASMESGTNASLSYGFKLSAAIQGILITAVAITALPYFSTQLASQKIDNCIYSLKKLSVILFAGGWLLIIPLIIFSQPIIGFLYERGAFNAAASERVSPIQIAYLLQIPFALVLMMGSKVLTAQRRNVLVSALITISIFLQAGLSYTFGIRYGATGIAIASTLTTALLALLYYSTASFSLRTQIYEKNLPL